MRSLHRDQPVDTRKQARMDYKTRKKDHSCGGRCLSLPTRTRTGRPHGLYLAPGVKEKEKVQSGIVVQVGPGYAIATAVH